MPHNPNTIPGTGANPNPNNANPNPDANPLNNNDIPKNGGAESAESTGNVNRATKKERGNKTLSAAERYERIKQLEARLAALNKREQEIENNFRAAGYDPEEELEKARARRAAKKASLEADTPKTDETQPSPNPAPNQDSESNLGQEPDQGPSLDSDLDSNQDQGLAEGEHTDSTKKEKDSIKEVSPNEVAGKAKKTPAFKKLLTRIGIAAAAVLSTGALIVGSYLNNKNAKAAHFATATEQSIGDLDTGSMDGTENSGGTVGGVIESGQDSDSGSAGIEAGDAIVSSDEMPSNLLYAGELPNGLKYDYTEYADRANKVSKNAYGHDYSSLYGDRAATASAILRIGGNMPEVLSSYAYGILSDSEKDELGIKDLNMSQLDDRFDSERGGALQRSLVTRLQSILEDENTEFKFYYENSTERTNYVYFIDENNDGKITPNEVHIAYDTKHRSNAPQVNIIRTVTMPDGTTKKITLDLNMRCGFQPNYAIPPVGVKHVPSGEDKEGSIPESDYLASSTSYTKPDNVINGGGTSSQSINGGGSNTTTTSGGGSNRTISGGGTENSNPSSPVISGGGGTNTNPGQPENQPENKPGEKPADKPETKPEDKPDNKPDDGIPATPNGDETPTKPEDKPDDGIPVTPNDDEIPSNPTSPNGHVQKDTDLERERAGEDITQKEIDNDVTPATTEEQDREAIDEVEEQKEEEAIKEAMAESVAETQAAAEAEAKVEAETREVANESNETKVAEADVAAEKAETQAAEEQQANHDAIESQVQDAEERSEAQQEADSHIEENSNEAASNAESSAEDKADRFANGDF